MNKSGTVIMVNTMFLLSAAVPAGQGSDPRPPGSVRLLSVSRSPANPLITASHSDTLGENINGPSVIRVPDWIEGRLGRYYMYFAHHGGKHIRLAYADDPAGPWTVYEPGSLRLEQAQDLIHAHIASPDVHVDDTTHTSIPQHVRSMA
jgi:hypothetical protein